MKKYIIRAVKFAIYMLAILLIMLLVIYFMSRDVMTEQSKFINLFTDGRFVKMLILVAVFGAIYPLFAFTSLKIFLNHKIATEEEKKQIADIFDLRKYKLISDNGKQMVFRPKNKFNRFMRMKEDALELDYTESTLKFKGMRKDIYRFKLPLEQFAIKDDGDEK